MRRGAERGPFSKGLARSARSFEERGGKTALTVKVAKQSPGAGSVPGPGESTPSPIFTEIFGWPIPSAMPQ